MFGGENVDIIVSDGGRQVPCRERACSMVEKDMRCKERKRYKSLTAVISGIRGRDSGAPG